MANDFTNPQSFPAGILGVYDLVFYFLCADPVGIAAARVNQIFCHVTGNLFGGAPQIALALLQQLQDAAFGHGHLSACLQVVADAWALAQILSRIA